MKSHLSLLLLVTGGLLLSGVVAEKALTAEQKAPLPSRQAPDKSAGKAIYTTCLGCHGNAAEGRDYMYAPNLTGQDQDYLRQQLVNFRSGKRGRLDDAHGYQMVGRATAIPGDAGVRSVVSFIASLPAKPAAPVAQRTVPAALASTIQSCAACHGAAGEGNAAMQAPAINRLEKYYIARQLTNFRDGKRGYHPDDANGAMMSAAAKSLPNEAAIKAIADFYGTD